MPLSGPQRRTTQCAARPALAPGIAVGIVAGIALLALATSAPLSAYGQELPSAVLSAPTLIINGNLFGSDLDAPATELVSFLNSNTFENGTVNDVLVVQFPGQRPTDSVGEAAGIFTVYQKLNPFDEHVLVNESMSRIEIMLPPLDDGAQALTIESDDGPLSPGVFADGESWVRINRLARDIEGIVSLDVDFSQSLFGNTLAGRVRINVPTPDTVEGFVLATRLELQQAQQGGVIAQFPWIGSGINGPAARVWISREPVLSPEEALLKVAGDRKILENKSMIKAKEGGSNPSRPDSSDAKSGTFLTQSPALQNRPTPNAQSTIGDSSLGANAGGLSGHGNRDFPRAGDVAAQFAPFPSTFDQASTQYRHRGTLHLVRESQQDVTMPEDDRRRETPRSDYRTDGTRYGASEAPAQAPRFLAESLPAPLAEFIAAAKGGDRFSQIPPPSDTATVAFPSPALRSAPAPIASSSGREHFGSLSRWIDETLDDLSRWWVAAMTNWFSGDAV